MSLELAPGSIRLRTAISNHLCTFGVKSCPGTVIVTTGDNTFLQRVFKLVASNNIGVGMDKICYFGCFQAVQKMQLNVHMIPSNSVGGFDTKFALDLIRSGKIKVLFLNPTLSNPLGYTIPEADRKLLVATCEEHGCFIIEDDIFNELQDTSCAVKPLKAWDHKGIVIYLGSMSKVIAPGLRVGWCLPGRLYSRFVGELLSENNAISSPAQLIASELLGSDMYRDHLIWLRKTFAYQARLLSLIIKDYFPEGTEISSPRGGGIFWVTLPKPTDATRFFAEVAAAGIKISPGSIFGSDADTPSFRLCVTKLLNLKSKAAVMEIGSIAKKCSLCGQPAALLQAAHRPGVEFRSV